MSPDEVAQVFSEMYPDIESFRAAFGQTDIQRKIGSLQNSILNLRKERDAALKPFQDKEIQVNDQIKSLQNQIPPPKV